MSDQRTLQQLFEEALLRQPSSGESVTPQQRSAAVGFFERLLGSPTKAPAPPEDPITKQRLLDKPWLRMGKPQPQLMRPAEDENTDTDLYGRLAIQLAQRMYPHTTGKVTQFLPGSVNLDPNVLAQVEPAAYHNGVKLSMVPQSNLPTAMRTIRHELSHVNAMQDSPDFGKAAKAAIAAGTRPTLTGAYETGFVSDVLNRDIDLPAERKPKKKGRP